MYERICISCKNYLFDSSTACRLATGHELWKMDNSPSGATIVRDIMTGAGDGLIAY